MDSMSVEFLDTVCYLENIPLTKTRSVGSVEFLDTMCPLENIPLAKMRSVGSKHGVPPRKSL